MIQLLNDAEIKEGLAKLPEWEVEDKSLTRIYEFKDFLAAIAFVNQLVEPAEQAGHHPDIFISYNRVTVSLTTHDAGGLTEKDLALAQVISQLN